MASVRILSGCYVRPASFEPSRVQWRIRKREGMPDSLRARINRPHAFQTFETQMTILGDITLPTAPVLNST